MDICYNRRKLQDIISMVEGRMNFVGKFYFSAETEFGKEEFINYLTT